MTSNTPFTHTPRPPFRDTTPEYAYQAWFYREGRPPWSAICNLHDTKVTQTVNVTADDDAPGPGGKAKRGRINIRISVGDSPVDCSVSVVLGPHEMENLARCLIDCAAYLRDPAQGPGPATQVVAEGWTAAGVHP